MEPCIECMWEVSVVGSQLWLPWVGANGDASEKVCIVSRPPNYLCSSIILVSTFAGIILWMHPANERRRYIVTPSLIGWAHKQNDLCILHGENPVRSRWPFWEMSIEIHHFECIPRICYERSYSEFYLSIWNQLVFNQRLQLFVQSPQPYLLIFAWRN